MSRINVFFFKFILCLQCLVSKERTFYNNIKITLLLSVSIDWNWTHLSRTEAAHTTTPKVA